MCCNIYQPQGKIFKGKEFAYEVLHHSRNLMSCWLKAYQYTGLEVLLTLPKLVMKMMDNICTEGICEIVKMSLNKKYVRKRGITFLREN